MTNFPPLPPAPPTRYLAEGDEKKTHRLNMIARKKWALRMQLWAVIVADRKARGVYLGELKPEPFVPQPNGRPTA